MNNVYIYGPLIIWFIAQLVKFSIHLVRGKADLRYFIASGGMPSAHAAVVCSLAVIALLDQGINSAIFGITAVMAAIVMYDSFGVRRSSGDQARLLNHLVSDLSTNGTLRTASEYQSVREILGHKPLEVTAGAALGILGGMLFEWNKLTAQWKYITEPFSL